MLLQDLSYHVVIGNGTSDIFLYSVDAGNGNLSLLAHFNVTSPNATCPWRYITQPAVRGNRLYMYGFITSPVSILLLAVRSYLRSTLFGEVSDQQVGLRFGTLHWKNIDHQSHSYPYVLQLDF